MMVDVKLSRNSIFDCKEYEAHKKRTFPKESICPKHGPSVGLPTGLEKENEVTFFFSIKRKDNPKV